MEVLEARASGMVENNECYQFQPWYVKLRRSFWYLLLPFVMVFWFVRNWQFFIRPSEGEDLPVKMKLRIMWTCCLYTVRRRMNWYYKLESLAKNINE